MSSSTPATESPPPARRHGSGLWWQGLVCGAAVTLATSCAVLAALLLAPGIAALVLEREPGRPAARVALICGVAMAAAPLVALWQSGQDVGGAMNAASDTAVLAGCWAAQGGGWLLAQLTPVVVRLILEAHARTQMALLRAERARYEDEWGIPPAEPGRKP